jgi:hypothetical protein
MVIGVQLIASLTSEPKDHTAPAKVQVTRLPAIGHHKAAASQQHALRSQLGGDLDWDRRARARLNDAAADIKLWRSRGKARSPCFCQR